MYFKVMRSGMSFQHVLKKACMDQEEGGRGYGLTKSQGYRVS